MRAVRYDDGHRRKHLQDHQQRHQGHRVLRLRRRRPGDGRGREHLPRTRAQADRPADRARQVPDRLQARHDRRRPSRRLHGHRRHRRRSTPKASSRKPPTTTSGTSNSQTDALIPAVDVVRRRDQEGRHRGRQGAVPDRPHLLRAHRAGRRVLPRRPRPAHRPARGRPRARPEVDRLPRAGEAAVGDRPAARHQRRSPTSSSPTSRNSTTASRHPTSPSTRPRSPVARRVCSTRSRRARSAAKRTSSATPTCGTSRPTSRARRPRSHRSGRSSMSATPTSARRSTSASPSPRRYSRSTARGTASSCTTPSPSLSAKNSRARSMRLSKEVSQVQGVIAGQ